MMPFGGLFQTITWSRGRAEKKHTELTGMSTASSRGDVSFGDKDKADADKKTSGRKSSSGRKFPKRVQVAPAPRDSGDED